MARPAPARTRKMAPNRKFRVWRPDSCEPIMIAPPAISAPISMSAAAQVRALEFRVLVNPANGSCARAGALDRSRAPSRLPTKTVSILRLPMGILPFAPSRGIALQAAAQVPAPDLSGQVPVPQESGIDLSFSVLRIDQCRPQI